MSLSLLACFFCQSMIMLSSRVMISLLNRRGSSAVSVRFGFVLKAASSSCSSSRHEDSVIDRVEVIIWSFFK
jgi:hypothetical protein